TAVWFIFHQVFRQFPLICEVQCIYSERNQSNLQSGFLTRTNHLHQLKLTGTNLRPPPPPSLAQAPCQTLETQCQQGSSGQPQRAHQAASPQGPRH
ncbi:Os09g0569000, partial [Oryza sativa Japonica Group]